jgi:peptide/nickel transport system substrate-binding protein
MFPTKKWRFHLPGTLALREGLSRLSFLERAVLFLLIALLVGTTVGMLFSIRLAFLKDVPASGGHLTEGVVGVPRFINPVIARSDADRDLTALIYSGLMRAMPDGSLIPDLAESYVVSEDKTQYTFTLKDGIRFHDGAPVTADDVAYTILSIQNPLIGSPLIRAWEGISVRAENEKTVVFKLTKPYSQFIDNTTVGILPRHLWSEANEETFSIFTYNSEPVGSGPFEVQSIERDSSGIPTAYTLTRFADFALGEPYIERITIAMYGNAKDLMRAFKKGEIDAIHDVDPADVEELAEDGTRVVSYPLPRVFALFFNQNHNELFAESAVREALSLAIDPQSVVDEVLYGYGTALAGPLPPPISYTKDTEAHTLQAARKVLEADGWTRGKDGVYVKGKNEQRLAFTITTASTPELKHTAEMLERAYDTLGADVSVEVFELGSLHQDVIRPRAYDALLFGQVVGRSGDVFPFWHSSQRNDPGLNISLYTNITVDDILSDIRTTLDAAERKEAYASLESEIRADHPAVFLYAPHLLYLVPKTLKGNAPGPIDESSDRFMNVWQWHFGTRSVVTKLE